MAPNLNSSLAAAAAALKRRSWREALDQLGDEAGVLAGDDAGVRARFHAYRAQALEGLGRLTEAERDAAEATRWAKREQGQPGVGPIRALHAAILARIGADEVARRAREADRPLADVPDASLANGEDGAGALVRKANVLIDLERPEEARASAHAAWTHPIAQARDRVLALLTLARCPGDEGAAHWILAGHVVADRADDQNLMTAVAKAASAAGVRLPLLSG